LQYCASFRPFLGDISLDKLHFSAKLNSDAKSELEDLMRTIPPVALVVSIFEAEAILGTLGE